MIFLFADHPPTGALVAFSKLQMISDLLPDMQIANTMPQFRSRKPSGHLLRCAPPLDWALFGAFEDLGGAIIFRSVHVDTPIASKVRSLPQQLS